MELVDGLMLTDISIDSTLKTALAVVVADLSDVSTALLHHASPIAAATAATCSLSWRLNVTASTGGAVAIRCRHVRNAACFIQQKQRDNR